MTAKTARATRKATISMTETVAQVRFAPLAGASFAQDQPAVAEGAQVTGASSVNGAIRLFAHVPKVRILPAPPI